MFRNADHDLSVCGGSERREIVPIRIDAQSLLPRLKALVPTTPRAEPSSLAQAVWLVRDDACARFLPAASPIERQTALCIAAFRNQQTTAAVLLGKSTAGGATSADAKETKESGLADPNAVDTRSGHWPAYFAVRSGNTEMLKLLIDAGADPSAINRHGDSLLHIAARYGRDAAIQLLLASKADPMVLNAKKETVCSTVFLGSPFARRL